MTTTATPYSISLHLSGFRSDAGWGEVWASDRRVREALAEVLVDLADDVLVGKIVQGGGSSPSMSGPLSYDYVVQGAFASQIAAQRAARVMLTLLNIMLPGSTVRRGGASRIKSAVESATGRRLASA